MNIKDYLKEQTDFINQYLKDELKEGTPEKLFEAMHYSLNAGGKRIRPVLVLESAKACGKENVEDIIDIAVAIEMIHTYSLIHDDLPSMDNDDLRRGKPTCHKVYGEAIAILAGDGLLTYAYEKISSNKRISPQKLLKTINILANNTGIYGMVAGQAADILAEKEKSFNDINFIHKNKTSKFLSACCQIGAVLSDADEKHEEALKNYGLYIGMAFQIWDDVLDEIGDTEKLGKTTGKDKKYNKLTFVSVYGLEKSKEIAKNYVEKALKELEIIQNRQILEEIAKFIISREV
jgi:geranylgeranyl diphosphate synthase type II